MRINLLVGYSHHVRVMTGRAADLVAQVLGMDRLVELLLDQVGFLGVAVGTGTGRLPGMAACGNSS